MPSIALSRALLTILWSVWSRARTPPVVMDPPAKTQPEDPEFVWRYTQSDPKPSLAMRVPISVVWLLVQFPFGKNPQSGAN
jgi:hypothetical protein